MTILLVDCTSLFTRKQAIEVICEKSRNSLQQNHLVDPYINYYTTDNNNHSIDGRKSKARLFILCKLTVLLLHKNQVESCKNAMRSKQQENQAYLTSIATTNKGMSYTSDGPQITYPNYFFPEIIVR